MDANKRDKRNNGTTFNKMTIGCRIKFLNVPSTVTTLSQT